MIQRGETIKVAHDFICPWCWIGLFQAKRLKEEFGVSFDWIGYELFPDELEWPAPSGAPKPPENPDRPKTPRRLDLAYAAENMERPTSVRPSQMRIHNAMEAVEYAKTEGVSEEFVEKMYRAYWEEGKEINNPAVIREIATGLIKDLDALENAIAERKYKDRITGFDEPAYASGVYNVPTFYIDGQRYAEEPYMVMKKAMLGI